MFKRCDEGGPWREWYVKFLTKGTFTWRCFPVWPERRRTSLMGVSCYWAVEWHLSHHQID